MVRSLDRRDQKLNVIEQMLSSGKPVTSSMASTGSRYCWAPARILRSVELSVQKCRSRLKQATS